MNYGPYKTFKFKGFFPVVTAVVLFISISIFLAFLVLFQDKSLEGFAFCLGMGFLFFVLGFIFVIGMSDIFVSPNSVSRKLFGKIIKEIVWTDVVKITIFPISGINSGKEINGYNIFSLSKYEHRKGARKIYFNDQSGDLRELINVLNFYIDKYNISVEMILNGRKTIAKSIPE